MGEVAKNERLNDRLVKDIQNLRVENFDNFMWKALNLNNSTSLSPSIDKHPPYAKFIN